MVRHRSLPYRMLTQGQHGRRGQIVPVSVVGFRAGVSETVKLFSAPTVVSQAKAGVGDSDVAHRQFMGERIHLRRRGIRAPSVGRLGQRSRAAVQGAQGAAVGVGNCWAGSGRHCGVDTVQRIRRGCRRRMHLCQETPFALLERSAAEKDAGGSGATAGWVERLDELPGEENGNHPTGSSQQVFRLSDYRGSEMFRCGADEAATLNLCIVGPGGTRHHTVTLAAWRRKSIERWRSAGRTSAEKPARRSASHSGATRRSVSTSAAARSS
jgi:hypothetical protein